MRKLKPEEARPVLVVKVTGFVRHGKSTGMAAIAQELCARKGKSANVVVWPPDGRAQDYAQVLGVDHVLVPEANPVDPSAVKAEIQKEVAKGTFNNTAAVYIDTITQLWEKALSKGMGGAKALSKSQTMSDIRAVVIEFIGLGIPVFIATHIREAATSATISDKSFKQVRRESVSDTELEKLLGLTWLDLEFFRTGPDPEKPGADLSQVKYGVSVRACRYKTAHKIPFSLMDTEENRREETHWRGILSRLESNLWGSGDEKVEIKELTWYDFGADQPFPSPERAISYGVRHFITDERFPGMKFYGWSDPDATRIRKDGTVGNSGAADYATRTYNAISPSGKGVQPETREKYLEKYGKITTPGRMAEVWKQEVEERCQVALDEFVKQAKKAADELNEPLAEEPTADEEAEALAGAVTEDEEHPEPVEEEVKF